MHSSQDGSDIVVDRCKDVNADILTRLCQLRQQKAQVLGYSDHATFVLEVRMAKSPTAVQPFLRELSAKLEPLRDAELEVMLEYKAEEMAAAGGENTTTTCAIMWEYPVWRKWAIWNERASRLTGLRPSRDGVVSQAARTARSTSGTSGTTTTW